MTQGFAFVEWPAQYRNAGVMTFVVHLNGVVYQKNLGAQTADQAKAITAINRGKTWRPVTPGTDEEAQSQ